MSILFEKWLNGAENGRKQKRGRSEAASSNTTHCKLESACHTPTLAADGAESLDTMDTGF